MGVDINPKMDPAAITFACNKNAVLQEAKVFSKVPINSKKCITVLTKVLYVINHGQETLSESEATDIFFGATRLFESNDERLRRLVYLLIKSIEVNETEIFIVTSSLTKDINSPNSVYRANAIRALCLIVKSNMASMIERYLKSSLVDRDSYVCSSALLCCIRIFTQMPQLIKRWVGEASACLPNSNHMVQFHATLLLFLFRLNDKQSLRKLVATLRQTKMGMYTECFIIRFLAANYAIMEKECVEVLTSSLKSPWEATRLEAVKSIISLTLSHYKTLGSMKGFPFDLGEVVTILQMFLSSKDQTLVFAAMKQVYQIAQTLPLVVGVLNSKVEEMLKRRNKDISSLALLTLLQTGGAETIERLLTQATSLSGDFKLAVTKALKGLCVSFPDKHPTVLGFFASNFREAVASEFKKEMIDATMYIVDNLPEAQAIGLKNLCEFIEDCEYPDLNAQVLKFLGDNVPKAQAPEQYVRYIYNRLILENATVRAAGIEALDKIVSERPDLKKSVSILLLPCLTDPDDEMRERVNLTYTLMLADDDVTFENLSVAPKVEGDVDFRQFEIQVKESTAVRELCEVINSVSERGTLNSFCKTLRDCIENECGYELIDDSMLEIEEEDDVIDYTGLGSQDPLQRRGSRDSAGALHAFSNEFDTDVTMPALAPEVLNFIPFGVTFIPSQIHFLTEEEEDYSVEAKLHASREFLVLEFIIGNTLVDQILENVEVIVDYSQCINAAGWKVIGSIPIQRLTVTEKKSAYLIFENSASLGDGLISDLNLLLGTVKVDLTFEAKSDEESKGYMETYSANDLHIGIGIYCVELPLDRDEFAASWESLENEEALGTFGLQFKGIKESVHGITKFFGGSTVTQMEGQTEKITSLNISGKLLNKFEFLAKATIGQGNVHASNEATFHQGCILKLQIRTTYQELSDVIFRQLE
ncbi:coatomer gamma subunit [Babesia gibsoni]|uniref:Coatomer subunit gamma n=1 Tax=Babesia gibsoni TaxID=33632 RepID=A0AAD8LJH3_BABGI|nr:coatomer gamma subunit [Babesia gibsoni]